MNDDKCDACGVNDWDANVDDWYVCFTCVAEFVKETDATHEAFEWWIENERADGQNDSRGRP